MTFHRTLTMASAFATAFALTACGGGQTGVISTPVAPIVTPIVTTATSIAAPAKATVPNSNLFPVATVGGDTITTHPPTTFPLLQSAITIDSAGVRPDTATNGAGSTLAFGSGSSSYVLSTANSSLGLTNVKLDPTPSGVFQGDSNGKHVSLEIEDSAAAGLSWTSFGFWDAAQPNGARTQAAFVTGYVTPSGSLPTTGTANYLGAVRGEVIQPKAGRENGVNYLSLSGTAYLDVDFATGILNGTLSNMWAFDFDGHGVQWNAVSLTGTFAGPNMFGGTTKVQGLYPGIAGLNTNATGTFAGAFFGPHGEELGAVWSLSDGTGAAFGTIGAKVCTAPCGPPGPWDY